ncbi:MAG: hypothetical protein K1X68_12335 [Saprospiraceae bacterium]|nr:hypothetical protein [Saprospiraceae bacterium]HMX87138.1 DUF5683 domain-containing protein [Saprospiraceae bacterium]HMZ38782.1 DUF5683 domain-containing protein [Saprospiraceae bacterium]HNA63197.1 DUF5683 domain-containing protein [Saprospiraceae bacterium]HNB31535.1 DUF5683 domain-containing protein [Saprospiraceae bacterium]
MRFICVVILLFLLQPVGISQSDSVKIITSDSTNKKKGDGALKVIFSGKPGKAFAYSLLVPGGGQIYNRKWWKLPIVYAGFGFTFYLVDFNRTQYHRFDNAFRMRVDLGETNSTDEFKGIYSLSALNVQRKYYDKNLQRSYLAIVGAYLLSGMDAFVDRHFMDFDISDKLSLKIQPNLDTFSSGAGISLCLHQKN